MTEKQIEKMMKTLKISREEAIDVIKEDERIDKMDMTEVTSDLTSDQKKNIRSMTSATGDKTKRKAVKRERKPDLIKQEIISTIAQNLDRCFFEDTKIESIQIVKVEREISFMVGEDEYSVTLIKHRKKKGES